MKKITVWHVDKVTNLGELLKIVRKNFPKHSPYEIGIELGIVNIAFVAKEKAPARKRRIFKSQM